MTEQNFVTEAFTELAPSYQSAMDRELSQFWGIGYRTFTERMLRIAAVQTGERVLDIATGTAVIPLSLKAGGRAHPPVVGLDITAAMLQEGRKKILSTRADPYVRLVCASAMAMPFTRGVFQVAICGLGTHHMDVPQMLAEVRRVLAPGGRLVISDVGATPFWRSFSGKLLLRILLAAYGLAESNARARAEVDAFKNVRTAQEWSGLLSEFGFERVRIEEIQPRYPWYPSGLTLTAQAAGLG